MKNSNEANRLTNQPPSECKHFYAGWLCKIRLKENQGYTGDSPCVLICDCSHCPDYEPKEH